MTELKLTKPQPITVDSTTMVELYQWDAGDEIEITAEIGNLPRVMNPGVYFAVATGDGSEYVIRVDGAEGEIIRVYPYTGKWDDASDFA